MRAITDHKLEGLNEALEIQVLDEPGQGGACHEYRITATGDRLPPWPTNGAQAEGDGRIKFIAAEIHFQNGPIKEFGVNGISGEALLAIVIDRLRCFQAGPYSSADNEQALDCIERGLGWLQKRTKDRLARGVEGTNQK